MPDPKDQRTRARIRLELTARIRQIAPPRNLVEVARTEDVSRNGILFRTREPYDQNSTVWITMPFHSNALAVDPEFPASVVRIRDQQDGTTEIAVQFHSAHADQYRRSYQGEAAPASINAQKRRARVTMTLPIRVRRGTLAEESVTVNISRSGVLFRTNKTYKPGETVMVVMPYQPGGESHEVPAEVVRLVERAGVRGVALQFSKPKTSGLSDSWEPTGAYAA